MNDFGSTPQHQPGFSKLQILGAIAAISVVGGAAISITKSRQPPVVKQPPLVKTNQVLSTVEPNQIPQTSLNRTIILVPKTQSEIDCVRHGGGLGCFESYYQPNYPVTSSQSEWQKWEREQEQESVRRASFWSWR